MLLVTPSIVMQPTVLTSTGSFWFWKWDPSSTLSLIEAITLHSSNSLLFRKLAVPVHSLQEATLTYHTRQRDTKPMEQFTCWTTSPGQSIRRSRLTGGTTHRPGEGEGKGTRDRGQQAGKTWVGLSQLLRGWVCKNNVLCSILVTVVHRIRHDM